MDNSPDGFDHGYPVKTVKLSAEQILEQYRV